MNATKLSSLLLAGLLIAPLSPAATLIVNGTAGVEGDSGLGHPMAGTTLTSTAQWIYDVSLLAGLQNGDTITGIRFRQDQAGNSNLPPAPVTLSQWDLTLVNSSTAAGSLSTTFADNTTGGTLVRSGSLAVAAESFPGGASPNAFGDFITFTTPFVYTGGNLVFSLVMSSPSSVVVIDAQTGTLTQYLSAIGTSATSASSNFGAAPVAELQFTPGAGPAVGAVPEPSTLGLAAAALALAGAKLRRRQ